MIFAAFCTKSDLYNVTPKINPPQSPLDRGKPLSLPFQGEVWRGFKVNGCETGFKFFR